MLRSSWLRLLRRWLPAPISVTGGCRRPGPKRRTRLTVEFLEDRLVPAANGINPGLVTSGPTPTSIVVVGADAGATPEVKVIDGTKLGQIQANGEIAPSALLGDFFAFDPHFQGGVSVAVGDVNGDGVPDVIVGVASGGPSEVKIIDGTKLGQIQANGEIAPSALLGDFFAFSPDFAGGVNLAAGDVNGDGKDDIIVGSGAGGSTVEVFSGPDLAQIDSFAPYGPNFISGVRVAAGDVNGDGKADIITGPGPGAAAEIRVFRSTDLALINKYLAYPAQFAGGVNVAGAGAFLYVGGGAGAGAQVEFTNPATGQVVKAFDPFPAFTGDVRVAAGDLGGNGVADAIFGAGPGGVPEVLVRDGITGATRAEFFAFAPTVTSGVFVAASSSTANAPPLILSSNSATFDVGLADSFTVVTGGRPLPSITESGALPGGVTFTDNGNGTATLAGTPSAGSGGVYSFTITAHNGIGSDATQTFTLTVTPPPAPSVPDLVAADDTGLSNTDNITNVTQPHFQGTAEPGAQVQLFVNGTGNASGTADAAGHWLIQLSQPLADGTYSISAQQTDAAGNVSPSSAGLTVVIDTIALPPDVPALLTGDDSGLSNADDVTNVAQPHFQGTAEPGAQVQLFVNGVANASGTADGTGHWLIPLTGPLADTTYSITAQQTDLAGNISTPSAGLTVVVDTTALAPSVPALTAADDNGSSNLAAITHDSQPHFQGTAEAGAQVQLFVNGVANASGTADGTGHWLIQVAQPLPDATYQIAAQQTDVAGNLSTLSTALGVEIKTTPPPTVTGVSTLNGVEGQLATLTITGTGFVTGSVVQVNGTPLATTFLSSTQLKAAFLASEEGSLNLKVVNPDGGTATLSFTISDAALTGSGVNVNLASLLPAHKTGPLPPFNPVSNAPVAVFTDAAGRFDFIDYSATIDWGDKTSSPGAVVSAGGANGTVIGSHTYAAPGRYTIRVFLVDQGGSTLSVQSTATIGSANERFLGQAFVDLLGRPIDPLSLAVLSNQLAAGTSRFAVVQSIVQSSEYIQLEVQQLYQRLLHRPADATGLNTFSLELAQGVPVETVEAVIIGSPEYFTTRGGGTNDGFLTALFADTLGRAPTALERSLFDKALANGTSTSQVATLILRSAEFAAVRTTQFFQTYLHRAPTPVEAGLVSLALLVGTPDAQIIALLVSSPEYFQRV